MVVADVTGVARPRAQRKHRMTIGGYVSPVQCRNISYTLSTSYIVHVILYRCMYIVLDLGAHARALVCTLVRRARYCMYVDSYGFTCTPTAVPRDTQSNLYEHHRYANRGWRSRWRGCVCNRCRGRCCGSAPSRCHGRWRGRARSPAHGQ